MTTTEQPLVIIPCGAAKLGHAAPAAKLYTGSYHRACARAAATITAQGGTVLVLSALHGLVPLDRVLEPYDMRMGARGSVTPELLRKQARELGVDRATNVVILAGLAYTVPALAVWPTATTPLKGLPGMGHQLRKLAAIANGDEQLAPAAESVVYAPRGLRNLTVAHILDEATGRAVCGVQLAGRNGAAVLTCAACRAILADRAATAEREAAERAATESADRHIATNHPRVAELLDLDPAATEAPMPTTTDARAERRARVRHLAAAGHSNRAIARQLRIGKDTVRRDLEATDTPTPSTAPRVPRLLYALPAELVQDLNVLADPRTGRYPPGMLAMIRRAADAKREAMPGRTIPV
ncbi:DUF6884 domain-containing protein [Streptomyces sp. NPDC004532]